MFELPSSQTQASPLRLSLVGQNNNQSISSQKKRKSNSIAGPSSFDEENRLQVSTNLFVDTTDCDLSLEKSFNQHITKSPRLEKSIERNKVNITKSSDPTLSPFRNNNNISINMMEDFTVPAIDTLNDDLKSSFIDCHPSPNGSECGTEVSSVSQRREWLKSFGKKQSSNIFRSMINDKGPETTQTRQNDDRNKKEARVANAVKDARQSPPASPKSSISFSSGFSTSRYPTGVTNSATKPKQLKPVINRRASSAVMMNSWKVKNHEGVQATDEGYASVASLSKWLESDPTAAKKMRHVRRGRNIISKSRQFEKDQGDVIIMESNISRGAVGDKKKWLKNAFQFTEEENPDDDTSSIYSGYVQSDVGRSVRAHPRFNRPGAQTEIITDDAASSLSVSDKKDWLKNAFSKNSEERKTLGYAKAGTDVMPNRGQSRDDTASRAKLMFKQRSTRKLAPASPPCVNLKSKEPVALASSFNSNGDTKSIAPKNNAVTKPESITATKPEEPVFRSKNTVQITESKEEEKAPVDFRSARDVLIERSKKNGHNTKVVNKVFLRKKKFEKLEEESRRKSIGVGLVLKTSWDLSDISTGRPSNAYEKKYVQAQSIAPKKSFEDLP
mmetsp:Transcript_26095/g.57168  ORF Transcript_26095/g.57168 Transcript_26095/m.57168 type:complete len:614 (+) Transcript_26095:26-1867(+)